MKHLMVFFEDVFGVVNPFVDGFLHILSFNLISKIILPLTNPDSYPHSTTSLKKVLTLFTLFA